MQITLYNFYVHTTECRKLLLGEMAKSLHEMMNHEGESLQDIEYCGNLLADILKVLSKKQLVSICIVNVQKALLKLKKNLLAFVLIKVNNFAKS